MPPPFRHLEKMLTSQLLLHINDEDIMAPHLVRKLGSDIKSNISIILSLVVFIYGCAHRQEGKTVFSNDLL